MKNAPSGKHYVCPKCNGPMHIAGGNWAILNCWKCRKSIDLWYEPLPLLADGEPPELSSYAKQFAPSPLTKEELLWLEEHNRKATKIQSNPIRLWWYWTAKMIRKWWDANR